MACDVSIVVVSYRSAELALRALAAAARSAAPLAVEEIVVENGSGEAALLRERRPQARVLALPHNRGFAAGNNAGIAHSRGRHLLLANPDAFAEGDAVAQLVRRLDAEPAAGVAAPLLRNADGSPQDNAYRRFPNLLTLFVDFCAPLGYLVAATSLDPYRMPRAALRAPRPVAHATGAALLVRADAARAAGPLDEGYFLYLEETEWQRRIAAAGWRCDVVPEARFTHLGGGSSDAFALASPHYLDSVERYYGPRGIAVAWLGTLVSVTVLRGAVRLGVRHPVIARHAGAYAAVLRALRARRRAVA